MVASLPARDSRCAVSLASGFASLSFLGSLPFSLAASACLATKDLVARLGLEQLAAAPVIALAQLLGVDVIIPVIGQIAGERFDTHPTSLAK